jgi:hypothetical protein
VSVRAVISSELGMSEEAWKPWRDGTYEVSTLGNVRRAKPGISTFVGRPVQPIASSTGYSQVTLLSDGKRHRIYVHQAIAEAFLGPRPDWHVVNHKDANKQNNAPSNLEYVTHRGNSIHAAENVQRRRGPTMTKAPKKGPQRGDDHWTKRMPDRIARGSRMPHSKLTAEIVMAARSRAASGEKQCVLACEYGVSVAQMSRIIRGTRWTAM